MPKLSRETQFNRIKEFLAQQGHDVSNVENPIMTEEEKILEADAVWLFWERKGTGFTIKKCKQCKLDFAYAYTYESVSFCSIECRRDALKAIGIDWKPGKDLKERWGYLGKRRVTGIDKKTKKPLTENFACYPAIVPPVPLEIMQQHLDDETSDAAS